MTEQIIRKNFTFFSLNIQRLSHKWWSTWAEIRMASCWQYLRWSRRSCRWISLRMFWMQSIDCSLIIIPLRILSIYRSPYSCLCSFFAYKLKCSVFLSRWARGPLRILQKLLLSKVINNAILQLLCINVVLIHDRLHSPIKCYEDDWLMNNVYLYGFDVRIMFVYCVFGSTLL